MTIKVNRQEWEALSPDQQKQIDAIISRNFDGQKVGPDDGGDLAADVGGACQIACNVARATAIAACNELPFGKGICIAAANAAGDFCLSKC